MANETDDLICTTTLSTVTSFELQYIVLLFLSTVINFRKFALASDFIWIIFIISYIII